MRVHYFCALLGFLCLISPNLFLFGQSTRTGPPAPLKLPATLKGGHTGEVKSLAFNSNGKLLASAAVPVEPGPGEVILWDMTTGRLQKRLKTNTHFISSVAFSPDDSVLASANGDGTVELWDVVEGKRVRLIQAHPERTYAVAFSKDGRTLATGGSGEPVNVGERIKLWDVATGRETASLTCQKANYIKCLAFTPDGQSLISGDGNGVFLFWDLASGTSRDVFRGSRMDNGHNLAISRDGRTLAFSRYNNAESKNELRLWDLSSRKENTKIQESVGTIPSLAFLADGKTVVTPFSGNVKLWDVETGKLRSTIRHPLNPRSVAISPDGKILAVGLYFAWEPVGASTISPQDAMESCTIKLWDVAEVLKQAPEK